MPTKEEPFATKSPAKKNSMTVPVRARAGGKGGPTEQVIINDIDSADKNYWALFANNCIILCVGKRGSGKTTFMNNFLKKSKAERVRVFGDKVSVDKCFRNVPYILRSNFSEEKLERILDIQEADVNEVNILFEKWKMEVESEMEIQQEKSKKEYETARLAKIQVKFAEEKAKFGDAKAERRKAKRMKKMQAKLTKMDENSLAQWEVTCKKKEADMMAPLAMDVYLDDLATNRGEALKSKVVSRLMRNSRHCYMRIIVSVQDSKDFPMDYRNAPDWVVFYRMSGEKQLARIHGDYATEIGNARIFDAILKNITGFGEVAVSEDRKRTCLIINKSPTVSHTEQFFIFHGKSTDFQKFKIGTDAMWKFNYQWCKEIRNCPSHGLYGPRDADEQELLQQQQSDDDDDSDADETDCRTKEPSSRPSPMTAAIEAVEEKTRERTRTRSRLPSSKSKMADDDDVMPSVLGRRGGGVGKIAEQPAQIVFTIER